MLPVARIATRPFSYSFSDRGFLLSFHKIVARAMLCADRHWYPQVFLQQVEFVERSCPAGPKEMYSFVTEADA